MIQLLLQFGDYSTYAEAALVLFLLAFLAVTVWVVTRPQLKIDRDARLPLDDNPPLHCEATDER